MRIAFDGTTLRPRRTGVGYYTEHLLQHLAQEAAPDEELVVLSNRPIDTTSPLPPRVRNTIDVIGHAFFLLPLTIIMIITSYPFVMKSVLLNEQSMNAGGLPQWPAKMLILIGFTLLFFQAISELIKRIAVMMGRIPDPYHGTGGLKAAPGDASLALRAIAASTARLVRSFFRCMAAWSRSMTRG